MSSRRCHAIPKIVLLGAASVAASFGACVTTPNAFAETSPVVAVNREVGLSITGNYDALAGTAGLNTAITSPYYPQYDWSDRTSSRAHLTSWRPGFRADAQYMFDIGRVRNLYAAGIFNLGSGDMSAQQDYVWTNVDGGRRSASGARYRDNFTHNTINVTGEIGKGFQLAHNRLMLTPVFQGGYTAGGGNSFTSLGLGYVGLALHADYALTKRLVIRGRAGWAEYLDAGSADLVYGSNGARPEWSGDVALDYRMTRRLHLTGGVRYAYMDYGHTHSSDIWRKASGPEIFTANFYGEDAKFTSASRAGTRSNAVQLRLGLAYQL
ncbi:hypothetical protein [Acetobacter nitrogenifigens]|uniref:Outer membrane protease n=1 Tax=Acetobacter nitrogenifigens DSM 23921 = NBRC 105050 TaxID=1120919 RepID=A0A511X7C8_9PROT|nr:hypothetical protein [Acetobacter nitrogenifigens]GEN58849.1 hypothetical protein ANI02nite_07330 [Acetobacter nitrogenifigens DSM 23921 = NBRC 105050]